MLIELYDNGGIWHFKTEDGVEWTTGLIVDGGTSKPLEFIFDEPVQFGEVSEAIRLKQSGFNDMTIVDILKMTKD